MKSFNGLYKAMMEHDEIKASIREAAKGKNKRIGVAKALANLDAKADEIAAIIETGCWLPPQHKRVMLRERADKKMRSIEKPIWDNEQIVHHMLMRQFRNIVIRSAYRYACGFISGQEETADRMRRIPGACGYSKGRGPLFAAQTMQRWVNKYQGRKFYVAELDVRKFYDNVDPERLKARLRKTIRDKPFLTLLERVIDGSGPGLPKGFYTSPWLANYYIQPLDFYIAQELRPEHYLRFVDNLYLLHANKRELRGMVEKLEGYLWQRLGLMLNGSRQIYRFEFTPHAFQQRRYPRRWEGVRRKTRKREDRGRAINAIGYMIHRDRITMRKAILKRARAKANHIHQRHRCTRHDAAAMLSYKGWFDHTDTYRYYQTWIKPKVSMRYCRRRLSALAKRERMEHDRLEHCA